MKRTALLLLATAALGAAQTRQAQAQSGFALKGHFIVNASSADDARENRDIPVTEGFDLGAEFILPFGVGIGISGYRATESDRDIGAETREFTVLAEANYFLRLPLIPIAPYAGVHAGLGKLSRGDISDPDLEIRDQTRSQLGYQFGLRFQASPTVGVDAQWRHMSTATAESQDGRFDRNQVLLGITLF